MSIGDLDIGLEVRLGRRRRSALFGGTGRGCLFGPHGDLVKTQRLLTVGREPVGVKTARLQSRVGVKLSSEPKDGVSEPDSGGSPVSVFDAGPS